MTAGLRAADRVVAPTASMLEALQRHYGPLMHGSVVPNGRDAEQFVPAEKEPFVFSAGRLWDRAKNVDAVIAAAARIPWPVVVAGPGGQQPNGATCLGRIAERSMAEWLGRASIVAHPARYEPFGLLPLEAGLAGCALVLGDIPSLREVWGDAAMFVAPDDHDALARAIGSLIDSEALRAEFAARARSRALTYTTAAMVSGYLTLYGCMAGGGRSPRRAHAAGAAEGLRCAS